MRLVFSETIMGKYKVGYYYSDESGLLKTEDPYWLAEAYENAINDADVGLVDRNIRNSNLIEALLVGFSMDKGKLLDVSGGYGMLTRLLRDKGFDAYTTDKYCQNLFAKSFEPGDNFNADVMFCFGVLEHVSHPVDFLTEMISSYGCKTIICSTTTFQGEIPPNSWKYYAFETGQHITFYQPRTLHALARLLGCNYYMINQWYHIITDRQLSPISRHLLFNKYIRKAYGTVVRQRRKKLGLTESDSGLMKQMMLLRKTQL